MAKIVVIGDSPLSFLVSRQLDQELARLTHVEVTFIRNDLNLYYLPGLKSLFSPIATSDVSKLLKNVAVKKAAVKQINLKDRRVVTDKASFDYDVLVLDTTPVFTASDITKIAAQCQRLTQEAQAKHKTGRSGRWRVLFSGGDVSSWQLALSLASDIALHSAAIRQSISIQTSLPSRPQVKSFLDANQISDQKSLGPIPGLTVASPNVPVKNRLVRGAMLDAKDNLVVGRDYHPEGHPEVTVVGGHERLMSNLWRPDQTLATQVVDNIELYMEGRAQKVHSTSASAGLLTGPNGVLVWIGTLFSQRLKARAISSLDRQFYRRLTSKS